MSEESHQAIYLLADSQPLFWRRDGKLFLENILAAIPHGSPKAAYIGASNGDDPEYYSIFVAAMDGIGIRQCRMIPTTLASADLTFLNEADLILLAGGDVERGWQAFAQNSLKELICRRYLEGVTLIGVSAGAVQLGLYGWSDDEGTTPTRLFKTLGLVPCIVSAHDEKRDWASLKKAMQIAGPHARGIGIPLGGGAVFRSDQTFEPIRFAVHEFIMKEDAENYKRSLLLPSISHMRRIGGNPSGNHD